MDDSKREKSEPLESAHALALVSMYIRDEERYCGKVFGGSKKNVGAARKQVIEEWKEELAAQGCVRSSDQVCGE